METHATPSDFGNLIDLLAASMGGEALACSDDFFAACDNLTSDHEPEWREEAFTERGKWMDGWESRRKRSPGNDWCILKLGVPGRLLAVDVDTRHFTGNHAPFAAVDGLRAPADTPIERLRDHCQWLELLPPSPCKPGGPNLFALPGGEAISHVRLRIFPAGGVARLRCFGLPEAPEATGRIDLAAAVNGSRAIVCSDQYFADMNQLISSAPAENMGSGWETKRRNREGLDWLVLALGQPGRVDRVELDTKHFRGNFPDRAKLEGVFWPKAPAHLLPSSPHWQPLLDPVRLGPNAEHRFDALQGSGPFTHVKLTIYPDGGVSRLRLFGSPSAPPATTGDALVDKLNAMNPDERLTELSRCCGAHRWAMAMNSVAPFHSRAQLFGEAENQWWRLAPADWLEAFEHHPKIGADVEALRARFATTASWSEGEQASMASADEATITALADGNAEYQQRFGYIFIVCASGKSAGEMLALLRDRLHNDPAQELFYAAGEQAKITALRLEKL